MKTRDKRREEVCEHVEELEEKVKAIRIGQSRVEGMTKPKDGKRREDREESEQNKIERKGIRVGN